MFQYEVMKNVVPSCLNIAVDWMNAHYLKINADKTDIIMFHPDSLAKDVIIKGTMIGNECIGFSKIVKNAYEYLNMNIHVNKMVSACFKNISDIGKVRSFLSIDDTFENTSAFLKK